MEVRQQLQLQVLQWITLAVCVVLAPLLVLTPAESVQHLAVRLGFLLTHWAMHVRATRTSAGRLGLVHVVLLYVSSLARAASKGNDFLRWAVAVGPNRILPLLAGIFGGNAAAIAAAAVSILTPSVGHVARMLAAGTATPYQVVTALPSLFSEGDGVLLLGDLYALTACAVLAVALDAALDAALGQMTSALSAKQQFITTMNHEIRTPLVGVLSITDLLLVHRDLTPYLANHLQIIHDSGRALLGIVNNILDMQKLTGRAAITAARDAVNVKAAVMETFHMFTALASSKHLHYQLSIDDKLPAAIITDRTRLLQILCNLIANAIKFTARGSVHVTVGFAPGGLRGLTGILQARQACEPGAPDPLALTPVQIYDTSGPLAAAATLGQPAPWLDAALAWLRLGLFVPATSQQPTACTPASVAPSSPMLWIKVTDTGIGITPDQLPRVILPFQQADASTTRQFGGSGLGLSICKQIVELLRGRFAYGSVPGRGTVFVVALPCEAIDPTPGAPSPNLSRRISVSTAVQPLYIWPVSLNSTPIVPIAPTASAGPSGAGAAAAAASAAAAAQGTGRATARRHSPPQPPPAHLLQRRRIVLIADDNQLNVKVLTRQLDRCGCDAIATTNGKECLDVVERYLVAAAAAADAAAEDGGDDAVNADGSATGEPSHTLHPSPPRLFGPARAGASTPPPLSPSSAPQRIDAILMDLNMPVMDGLTAAIAIRRLEAALARARPGPVRGGGRNIPIVAVTADDPETVGQICLDAGMDDFLRKPIVLSDLKAVLDVLDR